MGSGEIKFAVMDCLMGSLHSTACRFASRTSSLSLLNSWVPNGREKNRILVVHG